MVYFLYKIVNTLYKGDNKDNNNSGGGGGGGGGVKNDDENNYNNRSIQQKSMQWVLLTTPCEKLKTQWIIRAR